MNASSLPTAGRLMFDELLLRPNLRLRVGAHVVDIGALRVVTHPQHPRLTSKAVAVLIELARHAGDTVSRDALLDRVWADRVTTPDVLTQAIKELRRAFGDDAKPSRYIETIPRVGYRLLAAVSPVDAEPLAVDAVIQAMAGNDPELVATLPASTLPPSRMRPAWPWLLAAVVIAVVLAGWLLRMRGDAVRDMGNWSVHEIKSVTSDPGSERRPSVSPDGTRVAYAQFDQASGDAGLDRIVMRATGQSQSVRLTQKSDSFEEMPVWSPDGSQIAFERLGNDRCTIHIVSSLGGVEREVGACQNYLVNYFDWTPDSKALITAQSQGGNSGNMVLMRWDLASGAKQPLQYERSADEQDLEAHYSPDGRYIAFRRGLAPYSDICVMAAGGGAVRQLTQLHSRIRGLAWTQDSAGLIFASNHDGHFTLYTVALGGGEVRPLGVGAAEYPAAARAGGLVAYEIPRTSSRLASVALGVGVGDGVPELLAKSTGSDSSPVFAPDGQRIAFLSDRSGTQQVWLYDFATLQVSALTEFRDALLINPAWSGDGKHLLVTVRGKDHPGLVEIDLASRRQRPVSKAGQDILAGSYGPDADSYLLVIGGPSRENRLVMLEHAGRDDERQTLLAIGVEHSELDPAARRVYYTRNSQRGLFARDLAGGEERPVTPLIESSLADGWRVVDGRLWYVSKVAWKPVDIVEFDPATNVRRVMAHLEADLHEVGFSPSPARDRVAITPLGAEDTDIGSFRLEPAAG